jgi:hypothetical protein
MFSQLVIAPAINFVGQMATADSLSVLQTGGIAPHTRLRTDEKMLLSQFIAADGCD